MERDLEGLEGAQTVEPTGSRAELIAKMKNDIKRYKTSRGLF